MNAHVPVNPLALRRRAIALVLIVVVIIAGLIARHLRSTHSNFFTEYAADTLWAVLFFLLVRAIFPLMKTWRVAAISLSFTLAIELSQLCHANWLERVRATRIGGFALGHTFLWSDVICLVIGTALAVTIESWWFSAVSQADTLS